MADRVGKQLGNYRLIGLLGKGGFAEVYLGEHIYLKSQTAIKVMYARLADEDMESFLSEARTVVHLTHPLIVRVLDFGVEGNTPFLVMDYAPNGTLRERHPKGTRVPLATVVGYVKQVADALQYAHNQRLVHRDIKPENMLIGRSYEVLLSDFGIAIVSQTSLQQGIQDIAGTLAYMAPEQLQGQSRPASDQYALGVIVYEWLSGERPFHRSILEITSNQMFAPPPLRQKIPTLPLEVEQVVLTALAKDPHQRFASVRAFANALELASQLSSPSNFTTSLNSSPLPAHTPNQSNLSPQLTDILATTPSNQPSKPQSMLTPPNQPSQPGTFVTPPDHTLLAGVTNTPYSSSSVSPPPTSEPISYDKPQAPKQSVPRRALLISLVGLVFFVIAGILVLFSPTLMKWIVPPRLSSLNAHMALCGTTFSSNSADYTMFGFSAQHTHFIPDVEKLLPTNVSRHTLCLTATTGAAIYSSPAVANGVVYVGSRDHNLYAFNATTGAQLWTAPTRAEIWSSPAVANGVVYVGSRDHNLYAFNATTGAQLWTAPTRAEIYSSPTVANGVVYVGSRDHNLYAFNATTGARRWTATTGAQIYSSPAVANGVVYVGSSDHNLYAFNATTGAQLWTAPTEYVILSSPAVANGVVYVGSRDHNLYAFNATTGAQLWTAPTRAEIWSSPAVANGIVYIGSYDHNLYAFNATTGAQLWTAPTRAEIYSSPTVANGVVYVGSRDHNLYAFNATTGAQLWTAPAGAQIYSSPAVANGILYFGSYDHNLYAFQLIDQNKGA